MRVFKWVLFAVVVAVLMYVGYLIWGYTKIHSGTPRDLGVRYNSADYDSAVSSKAGVKVTGRESLALGSDFQVQGSKKIDQTFTDAEISAIENVSNATSGPFKDVQIHFVGGNQVEASGFITDSRVNAPVYVKGNVVSTGSKTFSVNISAIEAGSFVIPPGVKEIISSQFSSYVNGILAKITPLNVEKVEISNGSVHFVGTIPEVVKGE